MNAKVFDIEVFYVDPRNGWAVADLDEQGHQIGEAIYCYYKADALSQARIRAEFRIPITVHDMQGKVQRRIPATRN